MFTIDVFTLFASFGIIHSLILAFLFRNEKNRTLYNRLFSLLLIAASIRILKDVLINLYRIDSNFDLTADLWLLIENIGYSHTFALGPLFYLYFRSRLYENLKFSKRDFLHFLPFFVLILSVGIIPFVLWTSGGLIVSYGHFLIYFLFSAHQLFKFYQENNNDRPIKNWLITLLVIVFILMLSYSPTAVQMTGNIAGALLYSIAIIVVTLLIYNDRKMISAKKYKTSSLSSNRLESIGNDIKQLIINEQLFLDSTLTLQKLAGKLNLSTAHISQVINEQFELGYADFINSYRVSFAKTELLKKENHKYKIAHIAYESGFDSLSSFNSSFKKLAGLTPSQFREQELSN